VHEKANTRAHAYDEVGDSLSLRQVHFRRATLAFCHAHALERFEHPG
jgi:hypothetical protein